MEWGLVLQVGTLALTAAGALYGFANLNGKNEARSIAMDRKMDAHAVNMNQRMDKQDDTLSGLRTGLADVRETVATIKGKIGMNGHQ